MYLYKSKLEYDKDLIDKLLQIRIDSGFVSYQEVWNNRNIILQLMDEIQEFRNGRKDNK